MKKIPLATPTMHEEEQKYIQEAFDTNWISPLGPNVDADFCGQCESGQV